MYDQIIESMVDNEIASIPVTGNRINIDRAIEWSDLLFISVTIVHHLVEISSVIMRSMRESKECLSFGVNWLWNNVMCLQWLEHVKS